MTKSYDVISQRITISIFVESLVLSICSIQTTEDVFIECIIFMTHKRGNKT